MSEQADEQFIEFSMTHPGAWSASDAHVWDRVIASGWSPERLVSCAEVYRRLMDAQDGEPRAQKEWLADLLGEKPVVYERGDDYYECIAAGIRALRAGRRIGQEELAAAAGVQQATLSHVETGASARPRHETLELLAAALEVSLDDLVAHGAAVLA